MVMTARTTAVGVFTERALAENALEALHHAGYTDDQLGFVTREGAVASTSAPEPPHGETNLPTTAAGVMGGGVIGGVVAAAIVSLIPGLGLALVGGILGARSVLWPVASPAR